MTRLEQLRIDAHLSVKDLAAATGVPARTIRKLEEGTVRRPHVRTLAPLALHLGAPASTLLFPAVDPQSEVAA